MGLHQLHLTSLSRRYRYEDAEPATLDWSAELGDNSIERALREATGNWDGPLEERALARVEELRVSGLRLSDLTPLGRLPRLRSLWIRSRAVRSLAPLARLLSLRELVLTDLPVEDLAPLASLTQLERLRLENLPVRSLTPLAPLRALTDLCVRGGRVGSLLPLARLCALRELELTDGEPFAELEVLARLPSLRYVNLSGTPVAREPVLPGVHIDGLRGDGPMCILSSPSPSAWQPPTLAEVACLGERALRWPCTVSGLFTDGAQATPFAANPWGLPAELTPAQALERLWGPLERRAPGFLALLRARAFGLALLRPLGADQPVLAYLLRGEGERVASLLIGLQPRDPGDLDVGAFRLPCALRELYAVHAGLASEVAILRPPHELHSLLPAYARTPERFERRNGGQHADQFRLFCDDGDGEVFDLDRLDVRGDPIVRRWYRDTAEVRGNACFWDWFEDHAPDRFLGARWSRC